LILEVVHYTVDVVREDVVDKSEFHPVRFRKVIDHVPGGVCGGGGGSLIYLYHFNVP